MHKSAFERLWKTLTLPLEMSLCYLLGFVHLQQVASNVAMHTCCKMEISTQELQTQKGADNFHPHGNCEDSTTWLHLSAKEMCSLRKRKKQPGEQPATLWRPYLLFSASCTTTFPQAAIFKSISTSYYSKARQILSLLYVCFAVSKFPSCFVKSQFKCLSYTSSSLIPLTTSVILRLCCLLTKLETCTHYKILHIYMCIHKKSIVLY